jgi:hypothetical protein
MLLMFVEGVDVVVVTTFVRELEGRQMLPLGIGVE